MRSLIILFLILLSLTIYSKKRELIKADKTKVVKLENKKIVKKKGCFNGVCYIPAGDFMMGCNSSIDSECQGDEIPYHKVYLDGYYIDQYEVTVKEFKKCVEAGECSSENYDTKRDFVTDCNYLDSKRENHPMNCVNWNGANEYCNWVGKRLPTEAEWEKAARGTDGRVYPWGGEKVSCDYAVMKDDGKGKGCGKHSTWEVGSKKKGKSPYGLYDMSGNVWEWVKDYYSKNYYKNSLLKNPQGVNSGYSRVLRGGGWFYDNLKYLRASNRGINSPTIKYDHYGFRCAKSE